MPTESTAPLPTPKARKRDTSYRTRVVRHTNEKQLQLPWTEAPLYGDEVREPTIVQTRGEDNESPASASAVAEELPRRAYPLAYDPEGPAGRALSLLADAREEAAKAVLSYNEGDLDTASSRVTAIAALMAKTYPHTAFNPALGAVVSFLRRSSLLVDASALTMDALMSLAKATRIMADTPLLSLEGSAELVMELESKGWVGADPNVAAFVAALFGDSGSGLGVAETKPASEKRVVE